MLVGSLALTAAVGCDDSGDDDDDDGAGGSTSSSSSTSGTTSTSSTSSSGSSSGGTGHCASDVAATMCSGDCAFDPTSIDCTTACANIASVCGAGGCTDQCTGMESDPTLCSAGCEGTKNMHCTNLVFGCYASSDDCNTVGNCVQDNMDTNL
ncbi:MAG: hypothetical protein JRI68_35790 [Deltaproteobacteria bacterium]|nr:hypothetical protein [Deltaproteobacteria bacterium]